jgi:hypothetical protein
MVRVSEGLLSYIRNPLGGRPGGAGAELAKKQATRSCGVEEQAAPSHQYCCNTFFVDSSMYDTYTGITVMLHTGHTQGSTGVEMVEGLALP